MLYFNSCSVDMEVLTLSEEELMTQLLSDLCNVGLPVCEVDFVFRPYSIP